MFKALAVVSLGLVTGAVAAPNPKLCEMYGALVQDIAAKRDLGLPYATAVRNLTAAAAGMPAELLALSRAAAKVVYIDQPSLTPPAAYSAMYLACMTAK